MSFSLNRRIRRHQPNVRPAANARVRRWLAGGVTWLVLFAAILDGCTTTQAPLITTFSHFRADGLNAAPVRRVLLLPMSNETEFPYVEDEISDALATELRAAGLFEVVRAARETDESCAASCCRSNGTFDERQLIDLAERYQVDGVIFGTVTNYNPYWPPRIGINLQLVGTHEAVTLASVDGLWDARDEHIAAQAQQFYFCRLTPKATVPDSDLMLHAPQYFQKFAAAQTVHLLAGP